MTNPFPSTTFKEPSDGTRHIVAIGGIDAGISAALRIRELEPRRRGHVVVTDAYPNFFIPYYVSGKVSHWTNLAHHSAADCQGWSA